MARWCFCASSHSGFLRSDKPIGTAAVKLDKLETQSEIREIIEVSGQEVFTDRMSVYWYCKSPQLRSSCQVMDGRKPTGGRVEVKVRLREPLSGQDKQTSTERWLVIDHSQVTWNVCILQRVRRSYKTPDVCFSLQGSALDAAGLRWWSKSRYFRLKRT